MKIPADLDPNPLWRIPAQTPPRGRRIRRSAPAMFLVLQSYQVQARIQGG